jgi:hypothetical protein
MKNGQPTDSGIEDADGPGIHETIVTRGYAVGRC